MKNKKALGPIMAILFVTVVLLVGYYIGKEVANSYNKKHGTNKKIFEIFKIENKDIPKNYILNNGPKTLFDLCGKDTGICDDKVGTVTLDGLDLNLHIYANFDNPEDLATTYFKLNNKKIGSFVYLDKFDILDKKFLLITEPNSYNDNYIIHLYDYTGKEISSYEATNINQNYQIKNNELYYYYCNRSETSLINGEELPKVTYYKVNSDDITKKQEVSFEFKKCA